MLKNGRFDSGESYLDMELCITTLDEFLQDNIPTKLGKSKYFDTSAKNIECEYFSMWTIIKHIACGLDFLHSLREMHRDLKPSNGKRPFV